MHLRKENCTFTKVSGLQKGTAERGHVKKRQKSSKSVKNIFDTFRHFSRWAKNVKNRQKVSKIFSTLFDNFRAAPIFRPLLGGSDKGASIPARRQSENAGPRLFIDVFFDAPPHLEDIFRVFDLSTKAASAKAALTLRNGYIKNLAHRNRSDSLTLQSLLFSISLLFSFPIFLAFFLCVFPLFSKNFRGSAKRKTLAFLGGKPLLFPKKQGLEGQGLAHRNRSDFCDLRLRCPSRTPEIAAISATRESNAALRFKVAMECR